MASELIDTAQALLTVTDTAISKAYRDEDRRWRTADLAWRVQEHEFMQQQAAWRQEDVVQRELENARALWSRYVEKNRRDVEERAEQLKAISNLGALIAGFALVSFLQFDFGPAAASEGVQLAFGVTTALTVALEANAMVICSLIHGSILKIGRSYVGTQEEAEFMTRARQFAKSFRLGDRPPAPRRTFQAHWQYACEAQWRIAFVMFSAGVPVFFANMALAAWIKFDYSTKTAATMTAIMGAAFAYFLVAQNRWSWHLIGHQQHADLLEEALPQPAPVGLPWDWHRRPPTAANRHSVLQSALDRRSGELPLHSRNSMAPAAAAVAAGAAGAAADGGA